MAEKLKPEELYSKHALLTEQLVQLESQLPKDTAPANADEAWTRLVEANQRYAGGNLSEYLLHFARDASVDRRKELASSQAPFAIVLTCADSRVSPEIIFGQGLGNLFVVRNAGNMIDTFVLGSIEYAAEHLHSCILVVLGHNKCGAVKASLDTHTQKREGEAEHAADPNKKESSLSNLVGHLAGTTLKSHHLHPNDHGRALTAAVAENVRHQARSVTSSSATLKEFVESGKLKIIPAVYDFDTGLVTEIA